ncbi:MAG TPA: S8 family peptidase [Acidimicrobiales bacterium]
MPSKSRSSAPPPAPGAGRRELVVMATPDAGLRARADGLASETGADTDSLAAVLDSHGAHLAPLFGASEDRIRASVASLPGAGADLPDLGAFYRVGAPDDRLEALARELYAHDLVEAAYVKPAGEPPVATATKPAGKAATKAAAKEAAKTAAKEAPRALDGAINAMAPEATDAPPVTPDVTARQTYLDAAPGGIDARYAWTVPGGSGAGVRVIDCEWGWRFTHEDLVQNQGGVVAGTGTTDVGFVNHGTAVLGEISGDRNTFGITGIAPDAWIGASSFDDQSSSQAIVAAADRLRPGDIILLEIHRPGPRTPSPPQGQLGFIAIEWWPDDFAAIRYAVNKGIVVVEAAGNGFQNLDDPIYSQRPAGFPTSWRNPFDPANPSSGAVVVGAGAPPPNTHGRDWGPDRSRLDFSNYGARVDVQGWGREVTSSGYGDLQGGTAADLWYTDRFSGTSSASPIVVGALACAQGALRARGRIPLSPARAQQVLRTYGSPQQDAPNRPATQRIGLRPDLRRLIPAVVQPVTPITGTQFQGTVGANQTTCWFTFNWPAHWHVLWTVMPTTPRPGAPQVRWATRVTRTSDRYATYWICITNLTNQPVAIEGRYAVLGW